MLILKFLNSYKKHLALLFSFLMCVFFLVRILNPAPDTKNASQEFIKKTEPSPAYTAVQKTLSFEEAFPHVIKKNTPLFPHLQKLEVPPIDIIEMVKAAKPLKNLSRLSSGTRFQIEQDAENKLLKAQFRLSAIETLEVKKAEGKWLPQMLTEEISIEHVSFLGEVHTSLWESAIEAKMDPYLITAMAEIFGWEVDFNREVRTKDKWRITAEKKLVKGEHVGWGSVLAAEYINSGKSYKAVLFRHEGKDVGYYSLEGENLRKMFLKSPLRFGRVTSRFNRRRFHPKLKKIRPHNGVDYGASIGTPVRSVANGTVTFAGRRGGGGKVLKIRHNSTYKTAYKHLSRYAKGIRKGRQVKQGQIVAYTGNTGLSTGPHLHYEFFVNGRFVDPLRQKFPSADPVPKKHKASFLEQSQTMVTTLPKWFPKNLVLAPEKGSTPPLSKPTEKEYCCLLNSPKAQAVDQI